MTNPMAYFITFTTYGTWLHGAKKTSVDRNHNIYFTPHIPKNAFKALQAKKCMKTTPFYLNKTQRKVVIKTIKEICEKKSWHLFAIQVRMNHVHCLVGAVETPEKIMTTFKAYTTRNLKNLIGETRKNFWTRHGSTRYIFESKFIEPTINYIILDQGMPMETYYDKEFASF